MSTVQQPLTSPGFQQAFNQLPAFPIVANRAPTTSDFAQIGTIWCYGAGSDVWILAGISANSATWVNTSGGSGVFTTLTVTGQSTLGATTIVGTTLINASGAAATTIATGGTGTLALGNATGNTTVTGTLATAGVNDISVAGITTKNNAATAAGGIFVAQKARSGGVITTGDTLGSYEFKGNDGTTNVLASSIVSTSSGTIATNRVASNIELWTHPDSTSAITQRVVVASTGAVTINAPDSGVGLTITAGGLTVTAGTTTLAAMTQVGTTNINTSGSATTNIGTGGLGAVNIGNTTGFTAVTGSLTASTFVSGSTLYATGDAGGAASTTGLSNATHAAGGSNTLVIQNTTAGATNFGGYLKAYVGTSAIYIPYCTAF